MAVELNNRRNRHNNINSAINITPLVDVMLVLLIIFMVTSPMLITGIDIDLPQTQNLPLSGQDEPISIDIDKDGKIFLQKNYLSSSAELVAKLAAVTKQKMDTRIFVRADRNTDYGLVVEALGAMNAAGFNKVALVTKVLDLSIK